MAAKMHALIGQAVEGTGLSDFGPDGWQAGLEQLLDATEADLGDDPAAVEVVDRMVVGRLASRLKVEAWYADPANPDPPPVEGPLVIVGLPRTATTAMHYLLAVDPQFRYARQWEVSAPVPPPDIATEHDDPRRAGGGARGENVRHISSVDGPTEDSLLLALHFHSQEMALPVPTYVPWWRTADFASAFGYHERLLRLLHARRPPQRWLMKAPAYLFQLPALAAQYPGARFVMTHRDPEAALPSACSVVDDARRMVLPRHDHDKLALGPEILDHFALGVQRAAAARDQLGEDRFLDVGQQDVERDPLGTVERIYEFAGLELRGEVRDAMQSWSDANRRGSRGAHVYSAEEFGLTPALIRDAFASYTERYAQYVATAPAR